MKSIAEDRKHFAGS